MTNTDKKLSNWLIASDIDGTLNDKSRRLVRRNYDAIHKYIDEYGNAFKNLEKIYAKFLDEMDYTKNREENIEGLEDAIGICEQIYFHMRTIELLDKKLYLNKKNYKQIKKFYKEEDLDRIFPGKKKGGKAVE